MTREWLDITTDADRESHEITIVYAEAATGRIVAKIKQWDEGREWRVEFLTEERHRSEEFILREQAEKFVETVLAEMDGGRR